MPSRRSLFRALFVLPFLPLARMLGTAKAHDAGLGGYLLPDHLAKDAVRDMNSAIAPGLFNTTQVVATPTTPIGTLYGVPLHTNWRSEDEERMREAMCPQCGIAAQVAKSRGGGGDRCLEKPCWYSPSRRSAC